MREDEFVVRYADASWKARDDEKPDRTLRQKLGGVLGALVMVGTVAWLWLTMLSGSVLFVFSQIEGVQYVVGALRRDPSTALWLIPVALVTAALDVGILGLWAFGLRAIAVGWRSLRGGWWLRLTDRGLERSDRMGRPRLIPWDAVDAFMLVSGEPPGTDAGVEQVGYRLAAQRRRTFGDRLRRLLCRHLRSRSGARADGTIAGWWDRDADAAVALLDGWLRRHRCRQTTDHGGAAGEPIV